MAPVIGPIMASVGCPSSGGAAFIGPSASVSITAICILPMGPGEGPVDPADRAAGAVDPEAPAAAGQGNGTLGLNVGYGKSGKM